MVTVLDTSGEDKVMHKPTLAFNIEDKESHLVFPAIAQPKLDGVRCIAEIKDGKATLYSRTWKVITSLPHIIDELESNYTNDILDGELYAHIFKDNFNEIISRVKRISPHEDNKVIQLHTYDRLIEGAYLERVRSITYGTYIVPVESITVHSRGELQDLFISYRTLGYEGAMYRNINMQYEHKRGVSLLRLKAWFDAEYEVVDIIEGKGKLVGKAGSISFKHESGRTFKAKPMGDFELLTEYLENKEYYIGKQMTIKYQNLTPAGIPRFGSVLRIREDI